MTISSYVIELHNGKRLKKCMFLDANQRAFAFPLGENTFPPAKRIARVPLSNLAVEHLLSPAADNAIKSVCARLNRYDLAISTPLVNNLCSPDPV